MPENTHRSSCSKVAEQVFLVSVGLMCPQALSEEEPGVLRGHQHSLGTDRLGTKVNGKEKVGWHHRLNGHEQTSGDGEGQGSLVCCSPWGNKKLDTTE